MMNHYTNLVPLKITHSKNSSSGLPFTSFSRLQFRRLLRQPETRKIKKVKSLLTPEICDILCGTKYKNYDDVNIDVDK